MKLIQQQAPHIRRQESNRTIQMDMMLTLLLLAVLSYVFYGGRSLMVCLISVFSAAMTDLFCSLLRRRRPNIFDFSPLITGAIIAMMMPATIPYYMVVTANIFAIAVIKHPFGGTGFNLFNPAAAGFSFAAICWPQQVFMYPQPFTNIPMFGESGVRLFTNPAFVLKVGGIPTNGYDDLLLGNYPGPIGAAFILVIAACMLYLIYRRAIRWVLPVSFLSVCAFMALLFPRAGTSSLQSMMLEMMSGTLVFGAVFVLTDPVTCPKRNVSLLIYGVFAGAVTMLFRYFGGFEESMPFAILLANAFVPIIDRQTELLYRLVRRKRLGLKKTQGAPQA